VVQARIEFELAAAADRPHPLAQDGGVLGMDDDVGRPVAQPQRRGVGEGDGLGQGRVGTRPKAFERRNVERKS
jgi:hypothetical protein